MKTTTTTNRINFLMTLFLSVCISIFLVSCDSDKKEDKADTVTTDAMDIKENNSTVTEYITFVSNDKNKMTLDHAYTNEALLKLTSATSAMAGEVGFDIKGDLDKAKECADKITKNPFETSHADEIRKAADILSSVLQNMQVQNILVWQTKPERLKVQQWQLIPKHLRLTSGML